jgi:hypothetical protein
MTLEYISYAILMLVFCIMGFVLGYIFGYSAGEKGKQ